MPRSRRPASLPPFVVAAALGFGAPALADDAKPAAPADAAPTDATREAARALAWRGYETFQEKRFDLALQLFRDAEARFHAPTNLLFMARCEVELGHWVAAARIYDHLLEETLPPDASQPFRDAMVNGRRERTLLETTIPALRVMVRGAPADVVRVTIDGAVVNAGDPIRVDPGPRVVQVRAPAYEPVTFRVVAEGGGIRDVPVELHRFRPEVVATPRVSETGSWHVPWGIAATSLGATSIVGGVLSTVHVVTLNNDSAYPKYRAQSPPGMVAETPCQRAADDPTPLGRHVHDICNEASAFVTAQWLLYGAGIALLTTGTVLLLTRPRHADRAPKVAWAPVIGREGGTLTAHVLF